ncbi:hypothetical protein DYU05_20140 [Mucilaginibacter terrenus]|uniref:Uncharacterized protein n=1 Tax=Mucilaginibacter terrenus TaxID=2482727 RepID=A0A3E2NJA9_9SPHI|nr:hypothetical protein [Mucilaginibacter terrenus]RFZ81072.1 hypothetical protein DYU05_20140 [Mucilaginibacter terrenus]
MYQRKNSSFISLLTALLLLCTSCSHTTKVYTSDCNEEAEFRKVKFADLLRNPIAYDGQYIQIFGRFIGDRHVSALQADNTDSATEQQELWINFTPDCPLVQKGTHTGFFDNEEGHYASVNNHLMTIKCRVDAHKRGLHNGFAAILNDVSYLELK